MSIPKIIHYCWFGGNPLPKSAEKCIESWKKYCPDYELKLWNEENFDTRCNAYCAEMLRRKKWAFLTDYVRLKVVHDQGGVYLDTDVELIKPLDALVEQGAYMGFECSDLVATGLGFAAEAGHPFLAENMRYYEELTDFDNLRACPHITTELMEKHGLIRDCTKTQQLAGMTVYAAEYLCPKNERTGLMQKTRNTFSIHHYDASWFEQSWKESKKKRWRQEKIRYILKTPNRILIKLLGQERYGKLKKTLKMKNAINNPIQNRWDAVDVMKLLCALMVVVIHCKPLLPYSHTANVYTAEGVCRIAVPFFFAASGFLQCRKLAQLGDVDFKTRLWSCMKASVRNAKLYLIWSGVYILFYIARETVENGVPGPAYFADQLRLLFFDASCYHFWYMTALIYALPLMSVFAGWKDKYLCGAIVGLWSVQSVRFVYRWLPGGDVIPWDTPYWNAAMNALFCAVPMLMLGVLCFRNYHRKSAKQWLTGTVICFAVNIAELTAVYYLSPNKNHFEFLLSTPFLVYHLVNLLLRTDFHFQHQRVASCMRDASVWIYCVHPLIIELYRLNNDGAGFRRFVFVMLLTLLSAAVYVLTKNIRIRG